MSKKIGILTFHFPKHMGAVVQAYSLKTIIEKLGLSAEVINYVPPKLYYHSPRLDNPLSTLRKHILLHRELYDNYVARLARTLRSILGDLVYQVFDLRHLLIDEHLYAEFAREFLRLGGGAITGIGQLKHAISTYDVVVVGSDQVWNPDFLRDAEFAHLLPFKAPKVRKVAFSASIGSIDKLLRSEALKHLFSLCLKDFAFVSVRERQHVAILEKLAGRSIHHTLDPTLLVDESTLEGVARRPKHVSLDISGGDYIFVYNLDAATLPRLLQLVKRFSLPVIVYRTPSVVPIAEYARYREYRKLLSASFEGPREIVWLIRNTAVVATNSYHGLLLSIVFRKPVIFVIGGVASAAPDRITDIIDLINARNRVVSFRDWWYLYLDEAVVEEARQLLKPFREHSIELLKEALKD